MYSWVLIPSSPATVTAESVWREKAVKMGCEGYKVLSTYQRPARGKGPVLDGIFLSGNILKVSD